MRFRYEDVEEDLKSRIRRAEFEGLGSKDQTNRVNPNNTLILKWGNTVRCRDMEEVRAAEKAMLN